MSDSPVPTPSAGVLQLLSVILGDSVMEANALIGDQIRFWRWRNQLRILERANDILKQKGISPKKVSPKVLVPLIEAASLEDEPSLQEMWASLFASACQDDSEKSFFFICIEILKNISSPEARALQWMYFKWREEDLRIRTDNPFGSPDEIITKDDIVKFSVGDILRAANLPFIKGRVMIDNLMRLNLIRYEAPDISDETFDTSVRMVFPERLYLTRLAIGLLQTCGTDTQ